MPLSCRGRLIICPDNLRGRRFTLARAARKRLFFARLESCSGDTFQKISLRHVF